MADPIRQLLSQTSYAADGTSTVWNFSFAGGYLDQDHVKAQTYNPVTGARVDIALTSGNFVGPFQLSITPAIAAGLVLTVYRDTPKDMPLVNFSDKGNLSEQALDLNAKQSVFIAAEAQDAITTNLTDVGALVETVVNNAAAALESAENAETAAVDANEAAQAAALSAAQANEDAIKASVLASLDGAKKVGFKNRTVNDYLGMNALFSNRLQLLRSSCARGRSYFKKGPIATGGANSKFSVGLNMNGYNTSEWAFESDADDFWRIRYGYTGSIRDPNLGVDATVSGSYTAGPNPLFPAASVGSTLTFPFTGTGFIYQSYAEPRGGAFDVHVDGVFVGQVSCWAAIATSVKKTVFSGFSQGAHTAVLTFVGADPAHTPDAGGPRGYFKLSASSSGVYSALVITGNEMAMVNSGSGLGPLSILESPISATPTGSGLATSWTPVHGSEIGAMALAYRNIFLDGRAVDPSFVSMPTDEVVAAEFLMEQGYTAYNTHDTGKVLPMWNGVFRHKHNADGLTISHWLKTLRAITVTSAYSGDLATKITTFGVVELDSGFTKDCAVPASGTTSTLLGTSKSAVFYSRTRDVAIAVSIDSNLSSQSFASALGASATSGILLTERSDDVQKVYWKLFEDGQVIPAGTELRFEHQYFMAANKKYAL